MYGLPQEFVWVHSLSNLSAVLPATMPTAARSYDTTAQVSQEATTALRETMAGLAAVAGEEGVLAVQVGQGFACDEQQAPN